MYYSYLSYNQVFSVRYALRPKKQSNMIRLWNLFLIQRERERERERERKINKERARSLHPSDIAELVMSTPWQRENASYELRSDLTTAKGRWAVGLYIIPCRNYGTFFDIIKTSYMFYITDRHTCWCYGVQREMTWSRMLKEGTWKKWSWLIRG